MTTPVIAWTVIWMDDSSKEHANEKARPGMESEG